MASRTRKATVPKKAYDGYRWWCVPALVYIECPRCEKPSLDQPRVLRYSKKLDAGNEHWELEPLWPERGWLVQWECMVCGWEWHKHHDENYATTEQIEKWIDDFRAWYRGGVWHE
jgi:hypothetical protein